MICKRCKERVKDWKGDDPVCCFDGDSFDPNGWNCATMNELRDLAEENKVWNNDQCCSIIPHDGDYIVLGWYKNRGRTETALLIDGYKSSQLTIMVAERFLRESQ